MIHLSREIEWYVRDYKYYLQSVIRKVDEDCQYYANAMKSLAKKLEAKPYDVIKDWEREMDILDSATPTIMTILDYADQRVIDALAEDGEMLFRIADDPEDSDEIYTPDERREAEESLRKIVAEWKKEYELHVACMLEARALEIAQGCSGFLKMALLKFGVTTPTEAPHCIHEVDLAEFNDVAITKETVDKLIKKLDQKLENMTYEDILALYPKQKTPEKVEKEEKIVVHEEEPYDGPELPF